MNVFIICGLGGSGTRLLGHIFHLLRYDLGKDLNVAYDNLDIVRAFDRYRKLKPFSTADGDYQSFRDKLLPTVQKCYSSTAIVIKNPNLMYCLPHLKRLGEEEGFNIRFLHLIRDGLYMMNNKNKNQLGRWGGYFDLQEQTEELRQVEFWYKANTRVIKEYQNLELDYQVFHYDELVAQPEAGIQNVLSFIGADYDAALFGDFVAEIKDFKPASAKGSLASLPQYLAGWVKELSSFQRETR